MNKSLFSLLSGLILTVLFSESAFATPQFDDIGQSITDSMSSLPGLVAAFSYLSGIVIAVSAIFKTVDHVSNPTQTPVRVPVVRFLIGGALFSLPIIAEAVMTSINGGTPVIFSSQGNMLLALGSILGVLSSVVTFGQNVNFILQTMIWSVELLPGLIAATAYLLGLVIMVSALYKTRDHVEDPQRVPMKDVVIRFITAGALFSLPTIYNAMHETITSGGLGILGTIAALLSPAGFLWSSQAGGFGCGITSVIIPGITTPTLGDVICMSMINTISFPTFLAAVAYLIGLVFGFWGILKIRDHVNDPSRVPVTEGISRFIAGGAFFGLPFVVSVAQMSVANPLLIAATTINGNTGFSETVTAATCGTTNSLDEAMGCFMLNILGPSQVVLSFFGYVVGTIFIMIGISRLIKSSQEGARGPGGIGTFTTFVIGGMLVSAQSILSAIAASMFGYDLLALTSNYTFASLSYTTGMTVAEQQAALNVVAAVLKFMILIGMLSFVRGMFILREVAEGSQQASAMSGVTHLIGGALAVNLGPLLNAIQNTLGITAFGVTFGGGL